jgi:hypothetical protein
MVGMVVSAAEEGWSWGRDGHQILTGIAESRVTTPTLEAAFRILESEEALAAVSTWADVIRPERRETAPWHYVDFPIHTDEFDPARCPDGDCVTKIIDILSRLIVDDPEASPTLRRERLMFLIHFVGDQSQPLHNANEFGDRGANDKQVDFFGRSTNLHAIWDGSILRRYMEEMGYSVAETMELLNQEIRPEQLRTWTKGTTVDWTTEANRLAIDFAYPGWSPVITRDYYLKSIGVSRLQLQRGGVRLAHILNRMFDPNYDGVPVIQRPGRIHLGTFPEPRRREPRPEGSTPAAPSETVQPVNGPPGSTGPE